MKSLYILRQRLKRAQTELEESLVEFENPCGWDRAVENIEKEIAEALKQEYVPQDVCLKTLVWRVKDIGDGGEYGRAAELELLHLLKQKTAATQKGPASLITQENNKLFFSSISPWEEVEGVFLAYDVGYYD